MIVYLNIITIVLFRMLKQADFVHLIRIFHSTLSEADLSLMNGGVN
jgi:hypothetical protein